MRFFLILSLLIIVVIITACASQKKEESTAQPAYIYFGSGGGFSGLSKDYRLSANGKLEQRPSINAEWGDLGKIPKTTSAQLFDQIDLFDLKNTKHDYPGNRYHYIEVPGEPNNKITWGNPDNEPAKEVKTLHSILMKLTSKES